MLGSITPRLDGPVDLRLILLAHGAEVPASEPGEVLAAARRPEMGGKVGDWVEAFPTGFPRTLIVDAGATDADLRTAAGGAGRRIAKVKARNVQVVVPGRDDERAGRLIGESLGLLAWNGRLYSANPTEREPLGVAAESREVQVGLETGLALAASSNLARTWTTTPPATATPDWMADQAVRIAEETGLDCRILRGAELEAAGLQGLLTVGRASQNPPCLIRLEYRPESDSAARPIVLVGKTITYDTGGLSLKGKTGMPGMKGDKAGGCAVLGAMHALATVVRPNRRVVGLLVAAENSVDASAYRPDDVITFRNGVTAEITNTDAEGRLVLADGLLWAAEEEDPAAVLDIATLTGGVVTALGSVFAGAFASNDALFSAVERAGRAADERVWRLPLDPAYRSMMKSKVADLVNSNLSGKAHPVQ
ncbi:MAG: leucyl aminopeptidase family protein, partial [Fimbriimonadaceae bacterium]|nr:leucyl aminopeptidase family protein [Fimbriimonadaceae bacterium]